MTDVAYGQTNTSTTVVAETRAVGGVSIDTDGVLSNARTDDLGMLGKLRERSLEKIPAELNPAVEMRKISLRRLEAVLEECATNKKPIPDAMKYLAGLQHIHYLFVYPEQKDIVLVGPGEGWKVDAKGNVVGIATGRPVMLLDDLLVALRTARAAAQGGITCSIDPTPEGLARIKAPVRGGDPQTVARDLESALGMQRISVQGVPATSHFARVLVAADYRMKRIAMNFDPSPVRGLPNYLQMVRPGARTMLSPRFWLEPKYEALLRDADGLAFELRSFGREGDDGGRPPRRRRQYRAQRQGEPHSAAVGRHHDRQVPGIGRGRSDLRAVAKLHGLGHRGGLDRERTLGGEGRL